MSIRYVPYYIRGLMPLSFMVDDANLVSLRDKYTGYILDHQNISKEGAGWLGPPVPRDENVNQHAPPAQGVVSKYWAVQACGSHIRNQNSTTSGFEMCFAIGSQHQRCRGSQPKHVSNPA